MNKSTQNKLLSLVGKESPPILRKPSDSNFSRIAIFHDLKESAPIIAEEASNIFDVNNCGELGRLKLEQEEFDEMFSASKIRLKELQYKLENAEQLSKSAPSGNAPPHRWDIRDIITYSFAMILVPVVFLMGGANVYANLMASGQLVFIENPWIAVCLSCIVPAGSVALKFISNFFETYKTKKFYTMFIFGLTALIMLIWCIAFSLNFSGISGSIDWDSMGESKGKGSLLVLTQLLAEILIGTALFLAADDIAQKHAQEPRSTELRNAQAAYDRHSAKHEILRDKRNAIHALIIKLTAAKQSSINASLLDAHTFRARYNNANSI